KPAKKEYPMLIKKISPAFLMLLAATLACNLPAGSPPAVAAGPEASITSEVLVEVPITGATETSLPSPSATFTLTPTLTPTATITLTPTSSVPMVSVSENTNCRTGPGVVYDLVGALLIGEQAVVVGKYTAGNYWIINNPNGSGTCWLWGQYATVIGDTLGLPEYAPPPTPTPQPPVPPKNFQVIKQCIPLPGLPLKFNYIMILKWEDQADNETGYKVFTNDVLYKTLDADATQSAFAAILPPGVPFKFGVEAFNSTGSSARKSKSVSCP
ncbi:MAG TPA: hypothetical protein VLE49_05490, partial [Anaerolineales bacterium]|nr:hypothetical protein [Anaerolineales bacterium]